MSNFDDNLVVGRVVPAAGIDIFHGVNQTLNRLQSAVESQVGILPERSLEVLAASSRVLAAAVEWKQSWGKRPDTEYDAEADTLLYDAVEAYEELKNG